jgi:hypothetical protein
VIFSRSMKLGAQRTPPSTLDYKIKVLNIPKGQFKFGSRIISTRIRRPRYI